MSSTVAIAIQSERCWFWSIYSFFPTTIKTSTKQTPTSALLLRNKEDLARTWLQSFRTKMVTPMREGKVLLFTFVILDVTNDSEIVQSSIFPNISAYIYIRNSHLLSFIFLIVVFYILILSTVTNDMIGITVFGICLLSHMMLNYLFNDYTIKLTYYCITETQHCKSPT